MIFIDASKARSDFFSILDSVYLNGSSFLIKKAGIPVAEISRPRTLLNNSDLFKFAGIWSDIDANKIINTIYESRKDQIKLKRKVPKFS